MATISISHLKEAYLIERNLASFYFALSNQFREHREFWWKLSIEEENHASIFKTYIDNLIPMDLFPAEIIDLDLNNLRNTNQLIMDAIAQSSNASLPKKELYKLALMFEGMSGEFAFQKALEKNPDSKSLQLVHSIGKDTTNHASRIEAILNSDM